jgi:hypothetical protein
MLGRVERRILRLQKLAKYWKWPSSVVVGTIAAQTGCYFSDTDKHEHHISSNDGFFCWFSIDTFHYQRAGASRLSSFCQEITIADIESISYNFVDFEKEDLGQATCTWFTFTIRYHDQDRGRTREETTSNLIRFSSKPFQFSICNCLLPSLNLKKFLPLTCTSSINCDC